MCAVLGYHANLDRWLHATSSPGGKGKDKAVRPALHYGGVGVAAVSLWLPDLPNTAPSGKSKAKTLSFWRAGVDVEIEFPNILWHKLRISFNTLEQYYTLAIHFKCTLSKPLTFLCFCIFLSFPLSVLFKWQKWTNPSPVATTPTPDKNPDRQTVSRISLDAYLSSYLFVLLPLHLYLFPPLWYQSLYMGHLCHAESYWMRTTVTKGLFDVASSQLYVTEQYILPRQRTEEGNR